jgi:4-diphosphocytidyl-2-C-methyl-D-erythritol kinase
LTHTRASSCAKVNLFLHVTGRRPDGFHELFSLMTKISLADDMVFTFEKNSIQVTCDHPGVPDDETTLAHRAATLFFSFCRQNNLSVPVGGVSIHIEKKIPVGGGLGGGSSNAATVLTVLNAQCDTPFSLEQLLDMGQRLGADVPFFLFGGPALVSGIGEKMARIPDLKPWYVVLCDPGIHVPTAGVFRHHDFCLTSPGKYTIKSASNVLSRGQDIDIRGYMHNDLEAAAFSLYPEIRSTRDEMVHRLQRPVAMSGSGGSLFALFSQEKNARQGYELLCRRWDGGDKQIYLTALKNG